MTIEDFLENLRKICNKLPITNVYIGANGSLATKAMIIKLQFRYKDQEYVGTESIKHDILRMEGVMNSILESILYSWEEKIKEAIKDKDKEKKEKIKIRLKRI